MTRIIAGAAKGRTLHVPDGDATRPTSDRAREALFSRLEHDGWLEGTRVLDLYAGTGALGLEAASRGAGSVLLVERAAPAVRSARRNAEALLSALSVAGTAGTGGAARTIAVRAASVGAVLAEGPGGAGYDLVLADPPYSATDDEVSAVLDALVGRGWLAPDALVVVERARRAPCPRWPAALEALDVRRYGEAALWSARTLTAAASSPPEPPRPLG